MKSPASAGLFISGTRTPIIASLNVGPVGTKFEIFGLALAEETDGKRDHQQGEGKGLIHGKVLKNTKILFFLRFKNAIADNVLSSFI